MAHTHGNTCAKNLCKRTVLLQLMIENVVTCFFGTQCIAYHQGRCGLDLQRLTLRPIDSGPLHMPYRKGKEGWGVYPGVGGALLLPLLLAVRLCSVCKRERGEIEGLVLLF